MMLFALVCCCAALAPIVLCEEPAIAHISAEQIKSIGQEVSFNCTVQNNEKGYTVMWFRTLPSGNPSPLASGVNLIAPDRRFSVYYDNVTSTYTLRIKELQQSDVGSYQCQIIVSVENPVSAQVELQMRRPPTINRNNSTQSVEVATGTTVDLHCFADGFPVPRISWKREGDVLFSNGSSVINGNMLRLNNTIKDDRGLYYCKAENGEGKGDQQNVSVRVTFAPVVTAVRPRVGQARGYDIDLECKIEAYPAPKVTWYKGGKEIKSEQIKSSKDEFVVSLTRYSVGDNDEYGQYVCRAENAHGHHNTTLELFETVVPVCYPSCG